MKTNSRSISIQAIIVLVFIFSMVVSIGSIGYLIFTNWFTSAKQITESIAEDINESIYQQILGLIYVPEHINDVNYKIIDNGILNLSNEELREKFFVGILDTHDEDIYSFSYGTEEGEYYGARRNENGEVQIMRNNTSTGGNSWYYSVKDDLTAGELAVQAGKFDPRTRLWYKAAVEAGRPTFSPAYKHFVVDDLSISFSSPIYDDAGALQGVLGTHMLLADMGAYLENTVSKYNGYAVIMEQGSQALIANSMKMKNYAVLPDGAFQRYSFDTLEDPNFKDAYRKYLENKAPNFLHKGKDSNLYINVKEINTEGLNWVVITAVPEGFLMAPAVKSIDMAVLLTVLALLLFLGIYMMITQRLLNPINRLLLVSEALSSGDLTKRVDIVRNDEIGIISEGFNKVADKIQALIDNLEATVKERTEELHKANTRLEENKNQLQLILDSTAEAIYGMDLNGECTFCNLSCIKLLGYNSPDDLLGKNMHHQIHHTQPDGSLFPVNKCRIFQAIKLGKGFEADDEVFWKADGTSFAVEYHAYPQIRNGKVIGGVVTFMDITDRKKREAEIQYLSCHDTLTGLYNRRCFEDSRNEFDIEENLPLSIIFADINGLKLTNDIFGHSAGDELIKKAAEILLRSCRENDFIARVGGDEFVILLPNTNEEDAEKIVSRIKSEFLDARVAAIKCSISLGHDTKTSSEQPLDEIIANAENAMYKDKTMNRKSINRDIIDAIIEALHTRSAREKLHSMVVSELCREIGAALQLSELEINKLKLAGYLHDIGKITLDASLLAKEDLAVEELEKIRRHTEVGYRILNLFDDTLDLAEYVYSHHESWDGSGYPRGLKGEQIPLIARIVSIVETYERVLNKGDFTLSESIKQGIKTIKEGAGKQFDPAIVEVFVQMIGDKYRRGGGQGGLQKTD